MEEKIIVFITPFTIEQQVNIYKKGNELKQISVPLNDIHNILVNSSKEYKINNICLIGNEEYLLKIKKDIKETELLKNNKDEINVEIMEK